MRYALALALLALTASEAYPQAPSGPPASIGLPLPPIGLPLPVIGLPPNEPVPLITPFAPHPVRPHRPFPPAIVVFGAPPVWGYEPWQLSAMPGVVAQPPSGGSPDPDDFIPREETGRLRLDIKPVDAQLFVDGEFVGTWTDVDGELELRPGTHRIELRAPNFEAQTFDVRIVAGRTITYRASLTRVEEPRRSPPPRGASPTSPAAPKASAPPAAPTPPATFYLIPGCYLGNVPPHQVKLPADCDFSRMITHTPPR